MNSKIISFLLLAITASCTVEEQMAKLSDLNPKLAVLRNFGGEEAPFDVINNDMAQLFNFDIQKGSWVDFLLGAEVFKQDLIDAGIYGETRQQFLEKIMAKLDETLPVPTEAIRENEFMLNDGYMTMIPYALEAMRRELIDFNIAFIFNQGETGGEEGLSCPTGEMNKWGQVLIERIQAYAEMAHPAPSVFNQWIQKEGKTITLQTDNIEEVNKNIQKINDQIKQVHKMYEEYVNFPSSQTEKGGFLYESVVRPMSSYGELLSNISFYVHQEFKWQLLNAQIAPEEHYDEILDRIISVDLLLVHLMNAGRTEVKVDHLISYYTKAYKSFFSDKISDEKAEFASAILTQAIDDLRKNGEEKLAMSFAKKAVLERVDLGSTNSKFIRKSVLNTPIYNEEEPVESVLRLFDVVIEYEDVYYDAIKERVAVALDHIQLVLGFQDTKMYKNMISGRNFFTETLVNADDSMNVFKKLYALTVSMVASVADKEITTFASNLSTAIDNAQKAANESQDDTMEEAYFAMKIQIANLNRQECFPMEMVTPHQAQLTNEIAFIGKPSSKFFLQAINRGLKNLEVAVYQSTPIAQRVNDLILKAPFCSDKIKILKRLLI